MGKLAGMARHPLTGQGFKLLRSRFGIFMLAAVALYPACLLTHSCTEQRMLIGKRNAHAVAVFHLATPRHIPRIAGRGTEGGNVQINGRALAPCAGPIAGDAAQADSVQPLAGNAGNGTLG